MGLSSNQARFLSLTARQIDLEHRVQQICQRRLRLSNEMQRAANAYNEQTSDRRLFVNTINSTQAGTTSGVYNWINLPDLADNHLYILGSGVIAGAQVSTSTTYNWVQTGLGQTAPSSTLATHSTTVPENQGGNPPVRWLYTYYDDNTTTTAPTTAYQNFTPATPTPTSIPANAESGILTAIGSVSTNDLQFVNYTSYKKDPVDGIYKAETLTSLAIKSLTGLNALQTAWAGGSGLTITNYILTNNIDLGGAAWNPIGNSTNSFKGIFDGNGHTISGLTNVTGTNDIGFFGKTSNNATIKNLNISGANIGSAGAQNVGVLVGLATNGTTITNCSTSGSITAEKYGGGLVGWAQSSVIDICSSSTTVIGASTTPSSVGDLGGLVGKNFGSDINQSFATGSVGGYTDIGGLVGTNLNASNITNCYAIGNVTGTAASVGGLIGSQNGAPIPPANCYASGTVNGAGAGPLFGDVSTVPATCFYEHSVSSMSTQNIINAWNTNPATSNMWILNNEAAYAAAPASEKDIYSHPVLSKEMLITTPGATTHEYIWHYTIETEQATTTTTITYNFGTGSLTPAQIEEGLRNGSLQMVTEANPFTQDVIAGPGGTQYEAVDWRTQPVVSDDLYEANDEKAQQMYEKITRDVNTQDKRLQLEQTSVETEYNAVRSEKEAVEKIIDNNAKSSFKYFS